jgi:hypothetical protein
MLKFVLHYFVFPSLCAVVGYGVQAGGYLAPVQSVPYVGGLASLMGAAFIAAVIGMLGERFVILPLYKTLRGSGYREGEYGPPR